MSAPYLHPISIDRMMEAVEAVRQRLLRACRTLEAAEVPYAVTDENAVAAWVGRVDKAAVRNTQDVDIILRRSDFDAAKKAMEAAGFKYRHVKGIDMFLDGEDAKARDAVHVLYANEKVRETDLLPIADVTESITEGDFSTVGLEALVRMKLTSYRDKDRTHLRDMIGVELIDASWCQRFEGELGSRLQHLFDTPEG